MSKLYTVHNNIMPTTGGGVCLDPWGDGQGSWDKVSGAVPTALAGVLEDTSFTDEGAVGLVGTL